MYNINLKNKLFHGVIISFFFLFIFSFFIINVNHASASIWDKLSPNCKSQGDCKLNDFVQVAVNAAGWLLGITGSLALLALVYGGVMFLISGGSSERVTKAKQIIIGAIIGIAIVFLSYTIIGFVFKALGIQFQGNTIWSNSNWFNPS